MDGVCWQKKGIGDRGEPCGTLTSAFFLGSRDYQSLFLVGWNPWDGSRVLSNILRIPRERHCFHCDLVVKRKGARTALKSTLCPRGLRALAFRIPLNGCGSGTQIRLESPGETFGSRTGDLSPQQAPQFDLVHHGHRHRGPMKTALLHWEDAVLISERLVTNDS